VYLEGLMVERAMSIGLEEYGDRAFHLTRDQLDQESLEEAADLLMYEAIYDMKERKVIP
jgi:hypothetical protein